MKILLTDADKCSLGGHHYIYRKQLSSIANTEIVEKSDRFTPITKHFFKGNKQRKQYLSDIAPAEIMHLLYFDAFYITPFVLKNLHKRYKKVIGTLHWFPNNKMKEVTMKIASKYVDTIVVHSEYIKNQLSDIGVTNVTVIDYPSFFGKEYIEQSSNVNKNNDMKVFTCLGGTRFDKGADVLVQAFDYLSEDTKKKVCFCIAGAESDIKYSFIKQQSDKNNVKIELHNGFIEEEDYWRLIYQSDVITLPYRKIFTGNSGPMTDGIYANKFILGPQNGNLGYLIKKHNLGMTFISESPQSLAESITKIANMDTKKCHEYKEKLSVESFKESYEKLYKSIMK